MAYMQSKANALIQWRFNRTFILLIGLLLLLREQFAIFDVVVAKNYNNVPEVVKCCGLFPEKVMYIFCQN